MRKRSIEGSVSMCKCVLVCYCVQKGGRAMKRFYTLHIKSLFKAEIDDPHEIKHLVLEAVHQVLAEHGIHAVPNGELDLLDPLELVPDPE